MGIANAVNRLRDSEAKSRIVILFQDRQQQRRRNRPTHSGGNRGAGVRIYTIGAGQPGKALIPIDDPIFGKRYRQIESQLNEEELTKVAELTGGVYFRAKSEGMLKNIYEQISELEKTKFKVKEYLQFSQFFPFLLWPAGLLLGLELILRETVFRRLP